MEKTIKVSSKGCVCGQDNCNYACCIPVRKDEIWQWCKDFHDISKFYVDDKLKGRVKETDFEYPAKLNHYLFTVFAVNYEFLNTEHQKQEGNLHLHNGSCQPLSVEMAVSIRKFMTAFKDLILNNLTLFGVKEISVKYVKEGFVEQLVQEYNVERLKEMKKQARMELSGNNCKKSIVKTIFRNNLILLKNIRWHFISRAWRMSAFCSILLTNVRQTINKYEGLQNVSSNLLKLDGLFEEFVSKHYINVSQPFMFIEDPDATTPRTNWSEDANAEDNPATYQPNEFRNYLRIIDISEYTHNVDVYREQLKKMINEGENSVPTTLRALYGELAKDQLKLNNSGSAKLGQKNRNSGKKQSQKTHSNAADQKNKTEKQASQQRSSSVVRLVEHENGVTDMHLADGNVLQRVPRRLAQEYNLVRDTPAPDDSESIQFGKDQRKPKKKSKK